MKSILVFFTICTLTSEELFDNSSVHSLNIQFYNTNYDQILQYYWGNDDKTYELATIEFNDQIYDSVGVRYKGNSTFFFTQAYGSPKYPLNIDLNLIHENQNLLGYNKVKLSNVIFDPTYIKETIGYLSESYYLPTPKTGYVNVSINGQLIGLYVSVESINKQFLFDRFGNNDGTLIKCEPQFQYGEVYDAFPSLIWYGSDSTSYEYQKGYELKSDTGWSDLLELINTLNFDLENIENILNVDRVLWFFAVSMIMPDLDTYTGIYMHNYYLYKNTLSGQFEIIPWDKDNTFGGAQINDIIGQGGSVYDIYNWDPFQFNNDMSRPLISQLLSVPIFKKTYIAHMRTILDQIYNVEFFQNLAYELQSGIETYAQNDPNKFWPFTFGNYFQYNVNNHLITFGGGNWCGITSTVMPRIDFLMNLAEFNNQAPSILSVTQENDVPNEGEQVTIFAEVYNADTIELMYSIDPHTSNFTSVQMFDDGNNNDIIADDGIYSVVIPFNEGGRNVRYFIRAQNDDALFLMPRTAENSYYEYSIGYGEDSINSIVINEINYNSAENYESGDWIEIYNNSSQLQNLSNWILKDQNNDNSFIFPNNIVLMPYQYLIISNNQNLFLQRYYNVENIIGDFNFGLNSNGDIIRLYDENNNLIDVVSYQNSYPWPTQPNGNGPTLELVNPMDDNFLPNSWSVSDNYGSPGFINDSSELLTEEFIIPEKFSYKRAYPNPFNSITTIDFSLKNDLLLSIDIYNIKGEKISNLKNQIIKSGNHKLSWNAEEFSSGVYFVRFTSKTFIKTQKLILLK